MSATITALGSGDAFSAAGRGHTCWLLEDELGLALVDAGGSVLAALHRAGVAPERIAAIHFTHLHGDHIAGWPFLLLDGLYRARRTARLEVTGPPGTRERLAALWAACYPDAARKPLPFAVDLVELAPGEEAQVAGRKIVALAARHQAPPQVALSLRVEVPGRVLAFTGDTGPHQGLRALAAGAAALISECSELDGDGGDPALRKHLAWSDLRGILPTLGVRRVLLGHLGADARAAASAIQLEAKTLGLDRAVCDDGDRCTV